MTSRKRKRVVLAAGSNWSNTELDFFRIKIVPEYDFNSFFLEDPPEVLSGNASVIVDLDLSRADILETIDWSSIGSKPITRFTKHVLAVTKTHKNEESAVDDLAKAIFELLDYDDNDLNIRTREELKLEMCNKDTFAKPDLCIETSTLTIKLLVQEDKSYQVATRVNPEAQVVAEAIAAFQENNRINEKLDINSRDNQLIPCITMLGTCPTFYLFNVTKALSNAVKEGKRPQNVTEIKRYKIKMHTLATGDALLISKYKREIMQCYTALKKFVVGKADQN